ncbi:MAG: sirohydrochlorin chelatase [Pseudomonadota bacterium]
MNETILLVGHGSRNEAGNTQIVDFKNQLVKRQPKWNIKLCYIELADYLIEQGLNDVAKDAKRVIVVPLILNAAGHVNEEIPEFIAQAKQNNPDTDYIYAKHLGANDKLLQILVRQLKEAMESLAMADPKTTGVVILARGSSNANANGEMAKMARWLFETSEHELIDLAFTGVTYPRLETIVQRQVLLGMKQIVILPYYLFDGVLIERIKEQYDRLIKQYPQVSFAKNSYFGFEDEIFQLVEENIAKAGENG